MIVIISDQFLQIERRCYGRIDKVWLENGDAKYNIFFVPDGKKVGLASVKTEIDKKGDIKKRDLAEKVEEKKNKETKKDKKKKEGAAEQKAEEPKTEEPKAEVAEETKPKVPPQ
jgi:hypothetical protein